MVSKFILNGPSWAARSYDPPGVTPLHLAKLLGGLCLDLSESGSNLPQQISALHKSGSDDPVIWVYPEPLTCLEYATNINFKTFAESDSWKDIWLECNDWCLQKLNNLNRPILLIGGHSDIVNCDYPNIKIAHPSWQKFIADQANMPIHDDKVFVKMGDGGDFYIEHCWGAEIIHRYMHANPDIKVAKSLVDEIWNIFFFWKELEKRNLFCDVHPNKQATKLFAKHLVPVVDRFLKESAQ